MKYNIKNIAPESKFLFFWGHQPCKDGTITKTCFSQWWLSSFEVDGVTYKTAEHWMMAKKAELFNDDEVLAKIIKAKSPAEAKKLGREVKNYNETLWLAARFEIVKQGNYHKFSQHPELKTFLLNTKDRVIVEASPVDAIWGIGMASDHKDVLNPEKWKGLNLLGFALMEVRNELNKFRIMKIEVIKADITEINIDAIVNAANTSLLGGGGVDGAIHRKGGKAILEECIQIRNRQGGCKTGEAVITTAGNLPAKYVIHTVGPVWNGDKEEKSKLLADCYQNSLDLAVQNGIKNIAFPNISTGIYHFPKDKAAEIAIKTVKDFDKFSEIDKIIFVCFDDENYQIYKELLES